MIRLSKRLTAVYENLIPNEDVWDICCDHGYLGAAAYKSTRFSNIYFVDRVPATIDKLKIQFEKFVYNIESISKAHFICTAGQNIQSKVSGTVCITGLGGLTTFEILDGIAKNNYLNANRLILGPHKDEAKLLKLIIENSKTSHYQLKSEIQVLESDIKRRILILDRVLI